jgi:molecular chaperone GrpE
MSDQETTEQPAPEAPEPGHVEDAPKPQTEPDRPHGDPLTSDEEGSRHGQSPPATEPTEGAAEAPSGQAPASGDAEARAAEYLALAQRKQAEFENFRRRMNLQVAQAEDRGVAKLAKELLPALDHLELALQAAEKSDPAHPGSEWVEGIRLVQTEVIGALGRAGIQAFAPVGEPFDPNEHEAMVQIQVEGAEPGTVAQVYQAGYRLNGGVLRPARVVVAQ